MEQIHLFPEAITFWGDCTKISAQGLLICPGSHYIWYNLIKIQIQFNFFMYVRLFMRLI